MIEPLKREDIIDRVGGKFRFCALAQRRMQELLDGQRPLIDRDSMSDLELAIAEIDVDAIESLDIEEARAVAAESETAAPAPSPDVPAL